MKRIQDLQPHEAIEIRTKKEAKALAKLSGTDFIKKYKEGYVLHDKNGYEWILKPEYFDRTITAIYPASDFLKPTKKDLLKRIEALEKSIPFLITVAESGVSKLKTGKWYKSNEEHSFLGYITAISEREFNYYGFNSAGKWVDKDFYRFTDFKYLIPATDEEVKQALIAEAERRGYKKGAVFYSAKYNDGTIGDSYGINWHFEDNKLYLNHPNGVVFYKGKWAEMVEQPEEEIDWSVPGQKVQACDGEGSAIFLVCSYNSEEHTFSGVCVKSDNLSRKGEYYGHWDCRDFKPYKETITL